MADSVTTFPCLEILAGPEEGKRFPVPVGSTAIGRGEECAIRLQDVSLSRKHVLLERQGTKVTINDSGSRNGTFLNDRALGNEKIELNHQDQVRAGIYLARFLTEEAAISQEVDKPAYQPPKKSSAEEAKGHPPSALLPTAKGHSPKGHGPEGHGPKVPPANPPALLPVQEKSLVAATPEERSLAAFPPDPMATALSRRIKSVVFVLILLAALVGVTWWLLEQRQAAEVTGEIISPTPDVSVVRELPGPMPEEKSPTATPRVAGPNTVYLDVSSLPLSAQVVLDGKALGVTPFKVPLELVPDRIYNLEARFDLTDIGDEYLERQEVMVHADQTSVEVRLAPELGIFKINRIPAETDFYMEGYYAYDRYHAKPARIGEIVFGKPLYVPYGDYVIELRGRRPLGSKENMVSDIIYRRTVAITKESSEFVLTVLDQELSEFPLTIKSKPTQAEIFLDGELKGTTPFTGRFPLGRHGLRLAKEGYFDHSEELDVRMNTPLTLDLELKTSVAGERINKARSMEGRGQMGQAKEILIEALRLEATPHEKAEMNYLLGQAHLALGEYQTALIAFERAQVDAELFYDAMLGKAGAHLQQGLRDQALTEVVDVFLHRGDDQDLKSRAHGLFRQLSPLKSVIYVGSQPRGAMVYLNGFEVAQRTPVILSDLGLGHYRVEVRYPGYESRQFKLNLTLGDFHPIVVDLEPAKE